MGSATKQQKMIAIYLKWYNGKDIEDNMEQVRMIQMYRVHLSHLFGYELTELEACIQWCKRLALIYRVRHNG